MRWASLLEAVRDQNARGMGVERALRQHARAGNGGSQALAARWVILRAQVGDPARAMRALRPLARTRRARIVHDALVECLADPSTDHGAILARAQRSSAYRRLDPRGRTRLRQ